jgi:hypothetical protein
LLVAGLLREKSTAGWWLISQANRVFTFNHFYMRRYLHYLIQMVLFVFTEKENHVDFLNYW